MTLTRLMTLFSAGLSIAGCSTPTSSQSTAGEVPAYPDIITVERVITGQ